MSLMTSLSFFIIYIVVSFPEINSQKKNLNKDKLSESSKMNDCIRCKLLTESFTYWLDKTARGKHEGGDAAWEEAKLKSYSQSEMRLVEIQESLCSELKANQDSCYAIAEASEDALESWWFRENLDSSNLYNWLCIENLRHCCPSNYYGQMCSPCPQSKDNVVCSGNGKCDGDGTRQGNGTCICKRGYIGNICNKCAKNFYENHMQSCKPCHYACDECYDDGVNACVNCAAGWRMKSNVCVDVDECIDSSVCKSTEFCENIEGSYICKSCDKSCKTCTGSGPLNCTSCNINDIFWIGKCMSIDQQKNITKSLCIQITVYILLIILMIFMCTKSFTLGSVTILLVSIIMYYVEQLYDIGILYIIFYYYKI